MCSQSVLITAPAAHAIACRCFCSASCANMVAAPLDLSLASRDPGWTTTPRAHGPGNSRSLLAHGAWRYTLQRRYGPAVPPLGARHPD
eukprot:6278862-Alexandrium_andersonii.AAC.1